MYFDTKNYLKSTHNHTVKHGLRCETNINSPVSMFLLHSIFYSSEDARWDSNLFTTKWKNNVSVIFLKINIYLWI